MINKTGVLILVSMLSVTSISALAAIDAAVYDSAKSLTIANGATRESVNTKAAKAEINKNENRLSQGVAKDDTSLPSSGWILGMALFGFVMLSNRSGI